MSKTTDAAGAVGTAIAVLVGIAWGVISIWATVVLARGGNLPLTHHHVGGNLVAAAAWFFFGIAITETILWWAVMLLVGIVMLPFAGAAALTARHREE